MRRPEFDAVIDGLVRPGGPGAAVAVRQGGELIHSAGYGLANIGWGGPVDTETVFRIGSITKQFTAAAILRLAADGKLSIDDPVELHLPDFPVGERRITVRHLLGHTSGIKSYTAMPVMLEVARKDLPPSGLIDLFKDAPPDFAPGERYLYNNSGYVMLGAIIEAVAGKSYEAFLTETFFEPLDLTRTRYLYDAPIIAKRASGYTLTPQLQHAAPLSMHLPHAAGALGSTAEDLLAWSEALRGGKAVAAEDYAAMTTPGRLNDGEATSYGLGLLLSRYRNHGRIGHGGGINGFLSDLAYWPEHDLTIAVVSNSDAFPVQQAAHALARRALAAPDLVREPVALDDADLAACVGYYAFPLGMVVSFRSRDGALTARFPRPGSVFLPYAPGAFHLEGDPEVTLKFHERRGGAYQGAEFESYGEPMIGQRTRKPG
jgi:CubicO group peptidase (beta-lactamase class C family)